MSRPAIFLDRDGTINVEKEYLYRVEDWEWIAGAVEAIRLINQMGYLAIVITNQAGVARNYYDEAAIHKLHKQVDEWLAGQDAHIDAYHYCPHHPEYGDIRICRCRKPGPGLLYDAQRKFDIDLKKSWVIGDKSSDVAAALAVGAHPILVMTGYGKQDNAVVDPNVTRSQDLLEAVSYIQKIKCGRL